MKRRGRPPYPDLLTPRQQEVLDLLRQGLTDREIAERLGISLQGARFHVSEILGRTGLESRHEAARLATPFRRWWSLGPLFGLAAAPLRRLHWPAWLSPLATGGILLAAAAVIAGFTALVLATRDDGSSAGSPAYQASPSPSQMPPSPVPSLSAQGLPPAAVSGCVLPVPDTIDTDAIATAQGDFNGDGVSDDLMTYTPRGDALTHVRIDFQHRGYLDVPLGHQPLPEAGLTGHDIGPVGGYDLDGDGKDEAFVVSGAGAYTSWYTVFRFDMAACSMVQFDPRGADGTPWQFSAGASVRNLAGLQCRPAGPDGPGGLVQLLGTSDDGLSYRGTRQFFRLQGDQFLAEAPEDAIFTTADSAFSCGDLQQMWPSAVATPIMTPTPEPAETTAATPTPVAWQYTYTISGPRTVTAGQEVTYRIDVVLPGVPTPPTGYTYIPDAFERPDFVLQWPADGAAFLSGSDAGGWNRGSPVYDPAAPSSVRWQFNGPGNAAVEATLRVDPSFSGNFTLSIILPEALGRVWSLRPDQAKPFVVEVVPVSTPVP